MSYLQALSLLIFYLKYTDQLSVHGIAVVLPLIIEFFWVWMAQALKIARLKRQAKTLSDLSDKLKK